jgi:hypothetical protein
MNASRIPGLKWQVVILALRAEQIASALTSSARRKDSAARRGRKAHLPEEVRQSPGRRVSLGTAQTKRRTSLGIDNIVCLSENDPALPRY